MRGVELPRLERLQPLRPAPLGDLGEPLPARSPGAEGDRADDQEPYAQEQESMPPSPGPVSPTSREADSGRSPSPRRRRDDLAHPPSKVRGEAQRSRGPSGRRAPDHHPRPALDPGRVSARPGTSDVARPPSGAPGAGPSGPRSCILGIARDIDPLDLAGRPGIPNILHLRGIGQGDRHRLRGQGRRRGGHDRRRRRMRGPVWVGGAAGIGQGTARQDKNPRAARRTA